ncbi:UNVERIFIED_CONTAM: hypothetical protein Sangu_2539700 [Sesamum angustifolium]|uniref:Retrotransposon gag protein n=1 Tax=Sesamum angustifolium TaxID=2727405 RepID=A0AAW2JAA6_9LAMI
MIASGVAGPPFQELHRTKENQEVKKEGKTFSKAPRKKSIAVNITPFKLKSTAKYNVAHKNNIPYERQQRKLTLKEMQAREYPFLDSNVSGIFDDLLEANLIDLPEMKRPEEAERKDDTKYCEYHCLDGHVRQDCFMFKDKVMQLARQGNRNPYRTLYHPPHDPRLQSRKKKGCQHYKDAIDYRGHDVKRIIPYHRHLDFLKHDSWSSLVT